MLGYIVIKKDVLISGHLAIANLAKGPTKGQTITRQIKSASLRIACLKRIHNLLFNFMLLDLIAISNPFVVNYIAIALAKILDVLYLQIGCKIISFVQQKQ